MGGFGSGRFSFQNKVEECIRVELPYLKKRGFLKGFGAWDNVYWNRMGVKCFSVACCSEISKSGSGLLSLQFRLNGKDIIQNIQLVGIPMRFGGYRYYAICPISGNNCRTLVFQSNSEMFVSVRAAKVLYISQTEDRFDRAIRKINKVERQLDNLSKFTRKPKKATIYSKINELQTEWKSMFEEKFSNNTF